MFQSLFPTGCLKDRNVRREKNKFFSYYKKTMNVKMITKDVPLRVVYSYSEEA
jgi:hypothetical protein